MINIETKQLLIFTGINLCYCILGVFKDILRQRGTKIQSSTVSAICYAFYAIVVSQIAHLPLEVSIIGIIISNLVGDFIGRTLVEYIIPRGLVCYRFTIDKKYDKIDDINEFLEKEDLGYKWEAAHSLHNEYLCYQVYTHSKEQDRLVESLLTLNKIENYNRMEGKR